MKNKIIIAVSLLMVFVIGVVCGNLFEIRPVSAKVHRMTLVFEKMNEKGAEGVLNLSRSKIPGGWLVLSSRSPAFVPDPNHQWQ